MSEPINPADLASFRQHLQKSKRIVCVIGAGLSASSGLSTFRDTNGLWCNHDVFQIASPAGWRRDPGLVWQFYAERRREAMRAQPNPGHIALSSLAQQKPGVTVLSQNVDGLLQRTGLTSDRGLKLLHGNLFDLACAGGNNCGYVEHDNFNEPLCPVLSAEKRVKGVLGAAGSEGGVVTVKPSKASALLFEGIAAKNKKILGEDKFTDKGPTAADAAPLRELGEEARKNGPDNTTAPALYSGIDRSELPRCPKCKENLLRPRVVWFGESLPEDICRDVDALFAEDADGIDLCLVIGTSSKVWPTAGFADQARKKGAKVAWVNNKMEDVERRRHLGDWVFIGDAAVVLPEMLRDPNGSLDN